MTTPSTPPTRSPDVGDETKPYSYGAYCRGCEVLVAIIKTSIGAKLLKAWKGEQARANLNVRGLTYDRAHEELKTWGCRCVANRKAAARAALSLHRPEEPDHGN